jgi:hypothetical protein
VEKYARNVTFYRVWRGLPAHAPAWVRRVGLRLFGRYVTDTSGLRAPYEHLARGRRMRVEERHAGFTYLVTAS